MNVRVRSMVVAAALLAAGLAPPGLAAQALRVPHTTFTLPNGRRTMG